MEVPVNVRSTVGENPELEIGPQKVMEERET